MTKTLCPRPALPAIADLGRVMLAPCLLSTFFQSRTFTFPILIFRIYFQLFIAGSRMRYIWTNSARGQPGSEAGTRTLKPFKRSTSLIPSTLLGEGETQSKNPVRQPLSQASNSRKGKTSPKKPELECDEQPDKKTHSPQV